METIRFFTPTTPKASTAHSSLSKDHHEFTTSFSSKSLYAQLQHERRSEQKEVIGRQLLPLPPRLKHVGNRKSGIRNRLLPSSPISPWLRLNNEVADPFMTALERVKNESFSWYLKQRSVRNHKWLPTLPGQTSSESFSAGEITGDMDKGFDNKLRGGVVGTYSCSSSWWEGDCDAKMRHGIVIKRKLKNRCSPALDFVQRLLACWKILKVNKALKLKTPLHEGLYENFPN